MIEFGRAICGDLAAATRREWLVTNGIGGYASGTIAGVLTRRYHGLLIAALNPPLERTLLLSKLEETAAYADHIYPLFANRWADGTVDPDGFHHLERFHLEGSIPVWSYAYADALLEKRIWMAVGVNTTYIQYRLPRATGPLQLTIKALVNYRDHHHNTRANNWRMAVEPVQNGLAITAFAEAKPFHLLSDRGEPVITNTWYHDFYLSVEDRRGLDPTDDHLYAAQFKVDMQPGEAVTFVASTEAGTSLDGAAAYDERRAYERQLIRQSSLSHAPEPIQQVILAADQFIVSRALPGDPDGQSVIAGYHWFGDWGRDTMIALPGLTLATGRPTAARHILRTFARYIDRGMLPNRFPEVGEEPEYNTVDATLWYFEAIRAYYAAAGDSDLLRELFPLLAEIVRAHIEGTRHRIKADPQDGLLYAGEIGVQLTWMDAKVEEWVVTPRIGKPVEVNALWINAMQTMIEFAMHLDQPAEIFREWAARAGRGFERFWNGETGYLYDVLDGPDGDDPALRPNQLFAVSLHHSPLSPEQQKAVVDVCARSLLTSHGLRSLAPDHPDYVGQYGGDQRQRDAAYHQGTVWSWLIGAFVEAHLRTYHDPALARSYLLPLLEHLSDHGVGSISEIFEGDSPFIPRGCIAQAWGVAELLRAWRLTQGISS